MANDLPEFDQYAASYDQDLQQALSVTGEGKAFFAEARMRWLAGWMSQRGYSSQRVLDYGCGTGSATPYVLQQLDPTILYGTDVSGASLDQARESYADEKVHFESCDSPLPCLFDLGFCNGVFHHIAPELRDEALRSIYQKIDRGGLFVMFENNPWNLATRYVMSRCVFDRDAIMLFPHEARRRMEAVGFQILCTRYLFIFPAFLKWLRPLEKPLSPLPLGGQYAVIGIKR